jgi:tRNA(Ile)-lysidine synthase
MSDMPIQDLPGRFRTHLKATNLIEPGEKVLVAVSGGLDSVALLHLLNKLRGEMEIVLEVVHVHHGLRGAEADADLQFTRDLAEKLNLPFHFRRVETRMHAKTHRLSLEESARNLRYQAFDEILKEAGATKLATAHTADDQAETILDHLLRGSGVTGLRGMTPIRGPYIRPLLQFSREELEGFVRDQCIFFREDSSNRDLSFKRNRIRHELLPYLKTHFNPDLVATLANTANILKENESFLVDFAGKAYKSLVSLKNDEIVLEIKPFLNYFAIVQKYILFCAGVQLGIPRKDWTFKKTERVLEAVASRRIGKRIQINRAFDAYLDHDGLVIGRRTKSATRINLDLRKQDSVEFQRFVIRWSIQQTTKNLRFGKNKKVEFVDFDKTGHLVCLRTSLPGDRFIPLNFSGHKKIASLFSDQKVPHRLRKETPILESPNGIAWVGGYGIDDRFKVTSQTKHLLKLELIDKAHAT